MRRLFFTIFLWFWFTLVRVPRNPAFKDETPIYYINVILDEGVIVESHG